MVAERFSQRGHIEAGEGGEGRYYPLSDDRRGGITLVEHIALAFSPFLIELCSTLTLNY